MTTNLPLPFCHDLADEAATIAFGRGIAALLRPGDVVALWGDLGAGKSCLARAIIMARKPEENEAPSPTFTLVQTYGDIWHFDLYRIREADEIYELGWDEAREDGILLIEWPDRLGTLLPENRLDITLTFPSPDRPDRRMICLTASPAWLDRWSAFRALVP
ncbi:MAG TPA: tRNA (adenosine(37)-N6)-threonylcarbamoyltransferase complex ATPase subunit type 1 TsaE [Rhodospirillaceae bacterium]|nr:MAG: tRNA (adenosine(37)-N6)-threonylcarbamoyltransferase complex ATPase subunit type 1 TsaE [Alphaproteobacteria bacterium GWF2_58_20]HAU28563.1 tRNA (adenosine(37)-N6)-threonylcarbamoyltransferase complex ATPase subunit type 1 TsaE [Rhodospirillaceae bacterium]